MKFASGSHAFQLVGFRDGGLVGWWLGTGGWEPLLGGGTGTGSAEASVGHEGRGSQAAAPPRHPGDIPAH